MQRRRRLAVRAGAAAKLTPCGAPEHRLVTFLHPFGDCRRLQGMTTARFLLLAALALPAAGCGEADPPRADPATVERLVASMEAEPELPPALEKKVQKADRVAGSVLKVAPEKIDPDVAAALIAR